METEEDIYNPPEPVFYNYMALDKLVNNIDDTVLNNCAVIKICAYEIKNNGTTPYLKYLLHKDDFSDALLFPLLPLTYTNVNCQNVIKMATLKLFTLLQLSNYAEFECKISFKGFFMEHDQEIHIFFDLTECK